MMAFRVIFSVITILLIAGVLEARTTGNVSSFHHILFHLKVGRENSHKHIKVYCTHTPHGNPSDCCSCKGNFNIVSNTLMASQDLCFIFPSRLLALCRSSLFSHSWNLESRSYRLNERQTMSVTKKALEKKASSFDSTNFINID